jgi:hypothetical protein
VSWLYEALVKFGFEYAEIRGMVPLEASPLHLPPVRSPVVRLARLLFLFAVSLLAATAQAQDLEQAAQLRDVKNFRFSSSNPDPRSNVDFKPILPGKTLTLADVKGSGTIRRMWLTILPSEPGYSRLMTLRIYWDGEKNPSVECPIGDFFAVGHGLDAAVNSIPVRDSADGRARSCYWVMPFRKSARVTVTNDGSLATWCFYYQVDGDYEKVAPEAPYFHAMYHQEFPVRGGRYVVADIRGDGQYVGTVMSCRSTSEGWWGEGNDYFTVDGESSPSLKGTGFEDYFGEAWALRKTEGPYEGCPVFEGGFPGARSTCYRWHVPDPIRFRNSLHVEWQDMGVAPDGKGNYPNNMDRADEFSSAAFWYQTGPHAPYPPLPAGPDRLPFDYRRFIEAESLKIQPPASGKTVVVKELGLHGDHDLEWSEGREGDTLNLPFDVPRDGIYQIMVLTARDENGGLGRFLIDGVPKTERVSFYNSEYMMHMQVPLEMGELTAGHHVLSLKCLGKQEQALEGRWFAIDGFIVQPLRP